MKRDPPARRIGWEPAWRVIPTRFPRVRLFEDVAAPEELETVGALYALGNDRIREELGLLHRVPPRDRIAGPNTAFIMAAFTHINPQGSRFSDGSYGVFYCARELPTAVAESQFHLSRFYAATSEPMMEVDQRVLSVDLSQTLHDLRGLKAQYKREYSPDDYSASRRLGKALRDRDSWGVAYESVRAPGECAGVFRPPALSNCRERSWLCYVWDGLKFIGTYEKRPRIF
jgi:hypothetical protein